MYATLMREYAILKTKACRISLSYVALIAGTPQSVMNLKKKSLNVDSLSYLYFETGHIE